MSDFTLAGSQTKGHVQIESGAKRSFRSALIGNVGQIEREMSQQYKLDAHQEQSLPKILLIDDEPMNLEVLGSVLQERGFQSDRVSSGSVGIQLVESRFNLAKCGQAEMYKLVLIDFSMPDMDGPTTAKKLLSLL